MEIELHGVTKIVRSNIGGVYNDCRWREITIYTKKGEKLQINLFADRFDDLLIKEEN